jgi:regulator of sigma E protease
MLGVILGVGLFMSGLSIIICLHELGHVVAAKVLGVRVEVCSFGFGSTIFQRRVGDTYWRVSAFPFGGWTKLAGELRVEATGDPQEFVSRPLLARVAIGAMGSVVNVLVAVVVATGACLLSTGSPNGASVQSIQSRSSGLLGIQVGDLITAVNGVPVGFCEQFADLFETPAAKVTYQRGARTLTVVLLQSQGGAAASGCSTLSAAGVSLERTSQGWPGGFDALHWSVGFAKEFTFRTFGFLGDIVRGKVSPKALPGPIRFAQLAAANTRAGPAALLILMAMASLSMAIFNMLPIPILDGGVILMLVVEEIVGEIPDRAREAIFKVGVVFLVVVVTFLIYNDIARLPFLR